MSAASHILSQAIKDGAFAGNGVTEVGEYAVSRADAGIIAISDGAGWWTMDAEQLKRIAAWVFETQEAKAED